MESDLDKSAILECFVASLSMQNCRLCNTKASKIKQSIGEHYKKLQHTEVQHC
jgi:hypothetical protein